MTDPDRAVIEAAEAWADCPNVGNRINLECAVRAHRAAPKMVRCPGSRPEDACQRPGHCIASLPHNPEAAREWPIEMRACYRPEPVEEDQTISTVLDRLSRMPQTDFDAALAEHKDGIIARLVDDSIVPEREVRRREREAGRIGFARGAEWVTMKLNPTGGIDFYGMAQAEAAKRYPDTDADDEVGFDRDEAVTEQFNPPSEPDTQHGPINVDAGPSVQEAAEWTVCETRLCDGCPGKGWEPFGAVSVDTWNQGYKTWIQWRKRAEGWK